MTELVVDVNKLKFAREKDSSPGWTYMMKAYGCSMWICGKLLKVDVGERWAFITIPDDMLTIKFICGQYEMPKPPTPATMEFAQPVHGIRMPSVQMCKEYIGHPNKYIVGPDGNPSECGDWLVVYEDCEIDDVAEGVFLVNGTLYAPPYWYPEISTARCRDGIVYDPTFETILAWDKKRPPLCPGPVVVVRRGPPSDRILPSDGILPPELVGIVDLYLPGNSVITPHAIQASDDLYLTKMVLKHFKKEYEFVETPFGAMLIDCDLAGTYIETVVNGFTYVDDMHERETDVVVDDVVWDTMGIMASSSMKGFYTTFAGLCFDRDGICYRAGYAKPSSRLEIHESQGFSACVVYDDHEGFSIHVVRHSDMKYVVRVSASHFKINHIDVVEDTL